MDLPQEHGGGKATVIAWIWARTVPSPDPAFANVQVPIASTFLLNSKKGKEVWIEPIVDREGKMISYHIRKDGIKEEIDKAKLGTSAGKRQGFRCIMSGTAIPYDHIRESGKAGKMGQQLIAIVAEGQRSRVYVAPSEKHEQLALSTKPDWRPELKLPTDALGFRVQNYGLTTFGSLFTNRQLVALNTFSDLVHEARAQIEVDGLAAGMASDSTPLRNGGTGAKAYAEAVSVYLGFAVDRLADYSSSIASWISPLEAVRNTFPRQAIPMTWDYVEANPLSSSSGNWTGMNSWVCKTVANFIPFSKGVEIQNDAQNVIYPQNAVISTDPPYYDNIGYADLSDFFFCWMRRTTKIVFPDLFNVLATPKAEELVVTPFGMEDQRLHRTFFSMECGK